MMNFIIGNNPQQSLTKTTPATTSSLLHKYSSFINAKRNDSNLSYFLKKWLTHGEVNVYIWHHWVQVVVPTNLIPNGDLAYVYINGGSNPDLNNPPTDVDTVVTQVATSTGLIGVNLRDIPNQPVVFSADINGRARSEDALIAFTWSHFINNTLEYDWLARMPMTKASVLTMNVVQEFVAQHLPTLTPITRFAFAGGSKRGWTTWMVGLYPLLLSFSSFIHNY